MIEMVFYIVALLLTGAYFWSLLFQNPANEKDKADLVWLAGDSAEAKKIVDECLQRDNLQKRHVRDASKSIEKIVAEEKASKVLSDYKGKQG